MKRLMAISLAIGGIISILALDRAEAKPKPPACKDSRFLVGSELVPGEPASNALVIDPTGKVSLAPCGVAKGKAKPGKNGKGDVLKMIRWPKCPGASDPRKFKNIVLNATAASDCGGLTIKSIKGKNVPKRTNVAATKSLGCGDGLVDGGRGELCDGAIGCPAPQVCAANCTCVTPTTTTTPTTSTSSTSVEPSSTTITTRPPRRRRR